MSGIKLNTKVLVVDDSIPVRTVIKRLLSKIGLTNIVEAENGKIGFEKLTTADPPFDMVLLDNQMPVMDGETFVKKVRENDVLAKVVLYGLKTETDQIKLDQSANLGIDGFISKIFHQRSTTEDNLLRLELELTNCLLDHFRSNRDVWSDGISAGFESPKKIRQYNDFLTNYMPIEPNIIIPGLKIPLSIYTEKDTIVKMILEADAIVPEQEIFYQGDDIKKAGHLFVHLDDREKYKNFLKELSSGKIKGSSEKMDRVRAAVIKENSKMVTKDFMENPRSGETVKEAKNVVSEMIDNILNNPSSFYGLMKINTYDYYTYLHSINVCTLSIGLAVSLGLKKEELDPLAIGALMHDMGKSRIPSSIINKPGRLSEEEFTTIKNHVNWGHELLESHKDLPPESFIPLKQHHEKLSGKGYPNGIEGDQLHLFGRIASIVDIYDALTTERSYKKAFKPFEAVSILLKTPEDFDEDIFNNFVTMLGKQIRDE